LVLLIYSDTCRASKGAASRSPIVDKLNDYEKFNATRLVWRVRCNHLRSLTAPLNVWRRK